MNKFLILFNVTVGFSLSSLNPIMADEFDTSIELIEQGKYSDSVPYLEKLVAEGDGGAACNLGVLHQKGLGVEVDVDRARQLFRKAADQGLACGEFNLALLHQLLPESDDSLDQSLEMYKKASRQGHSEAGNNYAALILNTNLDENRDRARTYLEKSRKKASLATLNLALLEFSEGLRKTYQQTTNMADYSKDPNFQKAFSLFSDLLESENIVATRYLAHMHHQGFGTIQDSGKAAELYRIAADKGDSLSAINLGSIYANNELGQRDDSSAVKLFQQAAKAGNTLGMMRLGLMYQLGRGVVRDQSKALFWFKQAKKGGHKQADMFIKMVQ